MIKITPLMLLRLSNVRRWAAVPTIRQQTVDQHVFGVMVALNWLFNREPYSGWSSDGKLAAYEWALRHDGIENLSGDVPAPFKRIYLRELRSLEYDPSVSPVTHGIVEIADLLECVAFIRQEEALGNLISAEVVNDIVERILKMTEESLLADWVDAINPKILPLMELVMGRHQ